MIRSRALKRKEHMGLVWTPATKQFAQSAPAQPDERSAIFHTQVSVLSPDEHIAPLNNVPIQDELVGPAKQADFTDETGADVLSRTKKFCLDKVKAWSAGETVFRQGLNVWRNMDNDEEEPPTGKRAYRFRWQGRDLSLLKGINWPAVAWGWVTALALTVAVLGAAAIYVALTPGSVFYLSTYLLLNKVVSPLLGGVVTGWKVEQKGWQAGLWVGVGYGLTIMVFRMYGGLFSFWLEALTGLVISMVAGMVGGLLGRILTPKHRAAKTEANKSWQPSEVH